MRNDFITKDNFIIRQKNRQDIQNWERKKRFHTYYNRMKGMRKEKHSNDQS